MTYTEKELDQFLHGISLSLLLEESLQHWWYDEETEKEIEWLEALERKVRADKADRKTENNSEKPNNSTISKMEQVDKDKPKISCDGCRNFTDGGELCDLCALGEIDNYEPNNFDKDINVRSKDEPQTERSE